jgi:general secretion pathway protein G
MKQLTVHHGTKLTQKPKQLSPAFTIVELLIVIVVIAILAAITIISYAGITNRARETSLKSDLQNTSTKLKLAQITDGSYPSSLSEDNTAKSGDNQLTYTGGGTTFCLKATNPSLANKTFYITQEGSIGEGNCPAANIQTITASTCPTERTGQRLRLEKPKPLCQLVVATLTTVSVLRAGVCQRVVTPPATSPH